MERSEAEKRQITIHWWNFRTKTLDFKGSYKDWLASRNVKITSIYKKIKWVNETKTIKGFRLVFNLSSNKIRLDTWNDYTVACDETIRIYLTLLGDKAKFHNSYGQEYEINWR